MSDGILGYNMPLKFSADDLLRDLPLDIATVQDAFVTQREILKPDIGPWIQRGAIYDAAGEPLPEFKMMLDLYPGRFDNPLSLDAARMAGAERIRRPSIYLGTLNGHFGHFLVESLARAWALSRLDRNMGAVFHFANSPGALDTKALLENFPKFIRITFDLLGLTWPRLIFANRDLRFDTLMVPRAQFWINHFGGPGLCEVYDDIREEIVRRTGLPVGPSRKLYLTRQRLVEAEPHKMRKSLANEEAVERLFAARGFESVALEQLPFDEQVMVMGTASHIAGTTGSALHMSMFSAQPEAEMIAIDWRNSRTQYVLDAARGLRAHHIYCFDGRDSQGAPTADVGAVSAALSDIMSPAGAAGGLVQVYATALQALLAARQQDNHSLPEMTIASLPPPQPEPPAAQLSPERGLARFKAFQQVRPARARLAHQSPVLWILLDAIQALLGIDGDCLDVGVGLGATALLSLTLLKERERGVAVDARRNINFDQSLERMPPERRERLTFLETSLHDLSPQVLMGFGFRLGHIDIPPNADADSLYGLIERLTPTMKPESILILNAFFEPSSPDVTTAVYRLLAIEDGWKVLMIAFNKVYLVRAASKPAYVTALAREAKPYLSAFGGFFVDSNVKMFGDLVLSIKGNINPALSIPDAS